MLQLMRERGVVNDEKAAGHALQHRIYMRLGGRNRPEPDLDWLAVEPLDVFVLCSDGFWELVSQTEMQAALQRACWHGANLRAADRAREKPRGRPGRQHQPRDREVAAGHRAAGRAFLSPLSPLCP